MALEIQIGLHLPPSGEQEMNVVVMNLGGCTKDFLACCGLKSQEIKMCRSIHAPEKDDA